VSYPVSWCRVKTGTDWAVQVKKPPVWGELVKAGNPVEAHHYKKAAVKSKNVVRPQLPAGEV